MVLSPAYVHSALESWAKLNNDPHDREDAERETHYGRYPTRNNEPKVKHGKTLAVFLAT